MYILQLSEKLTLPPHKQQARYQVFAKGNQATNQSQLVEGERAPLKRFIQFILVGKYEFQAVLSTAHYEAVSDLMHN